MRSWICSNKWMAVINRIKRIGVGCAFALCVVLSEVLSVAGAFEKDNLLSS